MCIPAKQILTRRSPNFNDSVPPGRIVLFSDDDVLLQPPQGASKIASRIDEVLDKYEANLVISTEHDCFPPQFEEKLKAYAPSNAIYQCPNTGAWAGYAGHVGPFFESFVQEIDGKDKSIQGFMNERMRSRTDPSLFGRYKSFSNVRG